MTNILLIDEQEVTARGIKTILETHGCLVTHLESISKYNLADVIITYDPDLVIMDMPVPELAKAHLVLERDGIDLPLLWFTNINPGSDILALLKFNGRNHISKQAPADEIINGINTILRAGNFLCAHTRELLAEVTGGNPGVSTLSDREREIILLIAEGKSDREIADSLFLSYHTVRTHRKNISKKVGFSLKNAAELVVFVNTLNMV